jgi:hypothetical protein
MDLFEQYMKEVKKLKKDIPKFAKAILIEHKDVIIGLLQGQLSIGENSQGELLEYVQQSDFDGERIIYGSGRYAESTEKYWAQHPPYPIRPKRENALYNFQWTGDTFRMMDIDVKKDEFNIFSRDGKFRMLQDLYTVEAFRLSKEHNDMINEQMLLPLLEEKLADALADIV